LPNQSVAWRSPGARKRALIPAWSAAWLSAHAWAARLRQARAAWKQGTACPHLLVAVSACCCPAHPTFEPVDVTSGDHLMMQPLHNSLQARLVRATGPGFLTVTWGLAGQIEALADVFDIKTICEADSSCPGTSGARIRLFPSRTALYLGPPSLPPAGPLGHSSSAGQRLLWGLSVAPACCRWCGGRPSG